MKDTLSFPLETLAAHTTLSLPIETLATHAKVSLLLETPARQDTLSLALETPATRDTLLVSKTSKRPDGPRINIQIFPNTKALLTSLGLKLKPVRRKVLVRDCKEHRKQSFYMAPATLDWSDVFNAVDINKAVEVLEEKILAVMDKCMPQKSVRM